MLDQQIFVILANIWVSSKVRDKTFYLGHSDSQKKLKVSRI